MPKARGTSSPYKTLYFPDPAEFTRIQEKARAMGVSTSEYVRRAAAGEIAEERGLTPERLKFLEEDARYWRERFEQMASLAQDMQAEVLQLRQELRTREVARAMPGGASLESMSASLAPRILKVLTSLRSADGKFRVHTEAELRDEIGLGADAAQADALRAALADLFRLNLVEPQRNGWRARE